MTSIISAYLILVIATYIYFKWTNNIKPFIANNYLFGLASITLLVIKGWKFYQLASTVDRAVLFSFLKSASLDYPILASISYILPCLLAFGFVNSKYRSNFKLTILISFLAIFYIINEYLKFDEITYTLNGETANYYLYELKRVVWALVIGSIANVLITSFSRLPEFK